MIPLLNQLLIIIHCILIGLFLGVSYDSLSIILNNKLKKKNLVLRYFIELSYWFLIVIISSKYIIKNINYQLRVYTAIFFIIGVLIYYYFLAKKHRKTLNFIILFWNLKIAPFLKNVLLPIEVIKFLKVKFKKITNIKLIRNRKQQNEKNTTTDTIINN